MSRTLPGTRALRIFEAAGRHLNFTRAAAEVGLTPAAVSHQIKEIEEQLGLVLFMRTSRSIRLTPSGALLLKAAADALDTLQRGISRARRMARNPAHLRISTSARFATNWLLPRLPGFRAEHPALELTFDITDEVRDFAVNDIDLAIRFGTGNYDQARSDRLFDTIIAPVCSPKLIESGSKLDEPRDLLNHTLFHVNWKTDGMVWPNWRMWMAAAGVTDFDDSRCVGFTDSGHVVQAVIDGGGIGLADLDMIASDLADGRLVKVFDIAISVAPEYAYHLVYPESSSEDPCILAFREWIKAETKRQSDRDFGEDS
ncbi:LysR substrate-binding domain-containing protein [Rhizobium lentis]|uniref:HTH-type transcriptional regulator TtuA n=1 Tax=Rhizobium lentis TaxID=1138194 RepID=A0A7W8XKK7_9HYPH|nr:LysR substrate-binding domain-containing protein [Rhizobium lentis]MBB4577416.1 LysR family glycine cleavage system transcriptional activator [Rhizobium lentis]MBB5554035.1 LysR family glycine cleavage system transcriptional activator [Rhizobium lentis]MBB5564605.1 LysR family glycine cleavage system transcriptional activator [Rhizobium lentis]MBB5571147.1 LysR family glycine cleavage system transcriptional activator [Rhizobium lentis]